MNAFIAIRRRVRRKCIVKNRSKDVRVIFVVGRIVQLQRLVHTKTRFDIPTVCCQISILNLPFFKVEAENVLGET